MSQPVKVRQRQRKWQDLSGLHDLSSVQLTLPGIRRLLVRLLSLKVTWQIHISERWAWTQIPRDTVCCKIFCNLPLTLFKLPCVVLSPLLKKQHCMKYLDDWYLEFDLEYRINFFPPKKSLATVSHHKMFLLIISQDKTFSLKFRITPLFQPLATSASSINDTVSLHKV